MTTNPRQLSFGKFASEVDTFQSHQGNTIQLGHRKFIAPTNSYQSYEFLHHYSGPKPTDTPVSKKRDLYQPSKRPTTSIENVRSFEQTQHQIQKENKLQKLQASRSSQLLQHDKQTGYNLITGELFSSTSCPKVTKSSIRYLPDGLGAESHHRGLQIQRDSESRFFTPQPSGSQQNYRQKILLSEGLRASKESKILAHGCRESIPSYGVEDQFSKSQYVNRGGCDAKGGERQEGLQGLVEQSQPGKYSPRKQGTNNPSSNPQMRQKWTTGIQFGPT